MITNDMVTPHLDNKLKHEETFSFNGAKTVAHVTNLSKRINSI